MAGALCQVCASLQRHLHQSRVAGGLAEPRQAALDPTALALRPMRKPQDRHGGGAEGHDWAPAVIEAASRYPSPRQQPPRPPLWAPPRR
jgi:hypothetical protein